MASHHVEEEVDAATWAAWSSQLSPTRSPSSGRGENASSSADTAKLFKLAIELRDRLRFSQQRSRQLRTDLTDTRLKAAAERGECMDSLALFQQETSRLAAAVQSQNEALARQEREAEREHSELESEAAALSQQLQQTLDQHHLAMDQLEEANRTIARLHTSREEVLAELMELRAAADDSASRAQHHAKKHMEIMDQLLSAKTRVQQLASVESLYVSARDELQRLDGENVELKEMLNDGVAELGRSRILSSLAAPHHHVAGSPSRAYHAARGVRMHRSRSPTKASLIRTVQSGATALGLRVQSSPSGSSLRTMSPGRRGGGVASPRQLASAGAGWDTVLSTYPPRTLSPGGNAAHAEEDDDAGEMAFLGPPLSAYPADPENVLYGRTGGGYVAAARGLGPSKYATAKPSGWVPKDIVRLVQAFRHTYSIELEWRLWEPLLLMVDEVYRTRAAGRVGRLKTVQRERMKTMRRSLSANMSYPSALQSNKLTALKRQLAALRGTLGREEFRENGVLRAMAEKGYHVGHSLDRAVDENLALRRSLQQLDEMYGQDLNHTTTTTSYGPAGEVSDWGVPGSNPGSPGAAARSGGVAGTHYDSRRSSASASSTSSSAQQQQPRRHHHHHHRSHSTSGRERDTRTEDERGTVPGVSGDRGTSRYNDAGSARADRHDRQSTRLGGP